MYKIGLTGGIASGKSTVAAILRELGAPVIDADALSRELTAPGGAALPELRARFGDAIFEGGVLNRRALGALIFADASAREALNAAIHPLVFAKMEAQIAALADRGEAAVVLEIPLLFETGYDAQVDEIWLADLPREEQARRLMARDGLSPADADARIDSQWPLERKRSRARVRIDTGLPPEQLASLVRDAWQQTQRKAEPSNATAT